MPVLPSSLSPHICILPSPDLDDLLSASYLPCLPHILQSFSPLPQVTTRTTSLVSVPHKSFALRFSDLAEIEEACRESEEERAVRTVDWISSRISQRSAKWVEEIGTVGEMEVPRTPWWDELRRCTEGDHVPSRFEGWNHPVAVILAVSTMTANPLQSLTALHARALDLPSWVDPTILKYTLIVHPQKSNLSDEEAGALFNAVKKQYGLESYLLPLSLPSPPPPLVPVPALLPRLPSSSGSSKQFHTAISTSELTAEKPQHLISTTEAGQNFLRMGEKDIQATARFTREFVVTSLIPWMEKCVVEWNENYLSTRRLPSRLFSSTRRLFGSASSSPTPIHSSTTTSSLPNRPSTQNGGSNAIAGGPNFPSQQRRLAEFATILGDFKLAVSVWESLRKEGKGGAEVLPILLAPSPSIPLLVSSALSSVCPPASEPPPHAQLRALLYAIRWEIGIGPQDFLGAILDGEQWLVWAAGNVEEPPSALLLAHAALLSVRKQARRKAALWYLFAANRLEKCGIKPLTMYFLRRAHELYKTKPTKSLSPSFWDSEGSVVAGGEGFDAIMAGIEHPLGRLLYTTGDIAGAVQFFLGLLRGSSLQPQVTIPITSGSGEDKIPNPDSIFLEDFRIAFTHFNSMVTSGQGILSDLQLPFTFCLDRQTRLRLPRDHVDGELVEWEKREEIWKDFWRIRGEESLHKSGKAVVDETFWVDLAMRNPLDTDVNLSRLTIIIQESKANDAKSAREFVDVEVINDIILGARETRTIPISVKSRRPASLTITHATYNFVSLLPSTESLASRGKRLQETALQRQSTMYSPETPINVEVEKACHRLLADFVDDHRLVLAEGEIKQMRLWLSNAGTRAIRELWMVMGPEDEVWVDTNKYPAAMPTNTTPSIEIFHTHNSLAQKPYRIDFTTLHHSSVLEPGGSVEISLFLHAENIAEQALRLLFVFRENEKEPFHATQATRNYEVRPILEFSATAQPSSSLNHLFLLNVELKNVMISDSVDVLQLTTLSPSWKCSPVADHTLDSVAPNQSARLSLGVTEWYDRGDPQETTAFVSQKLRDVLHGRITAYSNPPSMNLVCSHICKNSHFRSVQDLATHHFIHSRKRTIVSRSIANSHPHIPTISYPSIFPLYHPFTVDVVLFWEIPSRQRSGHLLSSGITLGANHAILKDIVEEAESAKVKRSMYAETQRGKIALLDAIRCSEWNAEMNPVVVTLQDGVTLHHDFSRGSFHAPIPFTLRNYSLTHTCRFVLRLTSNSGSKPLPSHLLIPRYSGRLTFRGLLQPAETITLLPMAWITRPGTYALGGWRLETEIGENPFSGTTTWRTRYRYMQDSPLADPSCITICDTSPHMIHV